MRILAWIVDTFFPHRCAGCATIGAPLCDACGTALRTHAAPPSRQRFQYLDTLIAACAYKEVAAAAVRALKYRGTVALAQPLARIMLAATQRMPQTWCTDPTIVPVPLHPAREKNRGYNQAALLANTIAVAALRTCEPHALARTHHTASQVRTHSRAERIDNMRGMFTCPSPALVAHRDIILVDDVCTTGATLDDCARALKEAGARRVIGLVFARD